MFFSKQVGVALFYYVFEERPPLTTNSRPPVLFIYFLKIQSTHHMGTISTLELCYETVCPLRLSTVVEK